MIVVEVPVFYFSKQLVQRIGFVKMIIASHCVYVLRYIYIPVQFVHTTLKLTSLFLVVFYTSSSVTRG